MFVLYLLLAVFSFSVTLSSFALAAKVRRNYFALFSLMYSSVFQENINANLTFAVCLKHVSKSLCSRLFGKSQFSTLIFNCKGSQLKIRDGRVDTREDYTWELTGASNGSKKKKKKKRKINNNNNNNNRNNTPFSFIHQAGNIPSHLFQKA